MVKSRLSRYVVLIRNTERQYRTMACHQGIYEALEKCFDTSSRSPAEAIAHAHHQRDLKIAASEVNVETIKQLTWASWKFSASD